MNDAFLCVYCMTLYMQWCKRDIASRWECSTFVLASYKSSDLGKRAVGSLSKYLIREHVSICVKIYWCFSTTLRCKSSNSPLEHFCWVHGPLGTVRRLNATSVQTINFVWINKKGLVAQLPSTLPSGNQMCKHQAQTVHFKDNERFRDKQQAQPEKGILCRGGTWFKAPFSSSLVISFVTYWAITCLKVVHFHFL